MDRKETFGAIVAKRTIPFFGKLDGELYVAVRDALMKMEAESTRPITIIFDSTGGNTSFSLWLGDLVSILNSEVTGIVFDASSAALILLQYCKHRMIVDSGSVFLHSSRLLPEAVATCRRDVSWKDRMEVWGKTEDRQNAQLRTLFCRKTGLAEEEVRRLMDRGDVLDYQICADEAIDLKLVDALLPDNYRLFMPPAFAKSDNPNEQKDVT